MPSDTAAPKRPRPKSVIHLRHEDLGMRPMRGDAIAVSHSDRWYLTVCGIEAPSADTTNVRVMGPLAAAFSVLCSHCEASDVD